MPDPTDDGATPQIPVTEDDVGRVLDQYEDFLMALPNVVGVGSVPHPTSGEPTVAVYVSSPPDPGQVPATLEVDGGDGRKVVKTHIVPVGIISPQGPA